MIDSVQNISIEDYNYELPDHKIARYPLEIRDRSKLLIYENGEIKESVYRRISDFLPENSLLIFNETRVVQARLLFPKNEHTLIEVFCLQPANGVDIQIAMAAGSGIEYQCLVGGARKWKENPLKIVTDGFELSATKLRREEDHFVIRFEWTGQLTFAEVLESLGKTPLPPYLKRSAEEEDKSRYQTVYAKNNGSVAAPTAGLHFSKEVFDDLNAKDIERGFVTLHVGAGTFKPVSSEKMSGHNMHAEEFTVTRRLVRLLVDNPEKYLISVGTTSMRALESIYWMGALYLKGQKALDIGQWTPYSLKDQPERTAALQAILKWMDDEDVDILPARTRLIIAPGYKHRICRGLITNFHQPRSTLLLLVASMIGDNWKKVYDHALHNDFRFLSYGDGSLILGS